MFFAQQYEAGLWPTEPFRYQPGFVYYLVGVRALVGHSLGVIRLATSLTGAVACGFIVGVGWLLTGRRWGGYLTGLLMAVYPVAIFYSTVLLTEPLKWGMRLSVMEFELEFAKGRWSLAASRATLLDARTVPEDEEVANLVAENHAVVRTYVNSVIGTSTMAMSAATARFEDTAALDFINHVQAQAVREALAGTADESLPMLSIAAPFNRDAAIPAGDVTVRDVAGLKCSHQGRAEVPRLSGLVVISASHTRHHQCASQGRGDGHSH